ncbi:hypothetical protein E3P92_00136 [Wallemia ichthyophaga]|uniref:Uncharacterized protein n=1 Tax=Wallemia ichthyophaga (strain EXF-994 / CBS 113033) TaxID=1299270 RepID=R9APR8_WALI9|nr:uncharacterized protein J056_002285 [Wallemia ichthyophaga EXF-994]EOR04207.1 hypothetical protein J056_002285 [Wallemia ichthyophaga EXF-994]TIB19175.1 hypothetical protein E3P92_00136 [Wallemia ichthyophaga]TIB37774.1 hypothetical protein E3P84_00138 [Wallemia ichthyophaga]TIB44643.1 hypothetical protein E3P83_00138 [Wallemia ichthyophaga]
MITKVFYITGTSSGFGRELVLDLASRGHKVIATALSTDWIEDFAKLDNVKTQKVDVTDSPTILQQKVEEAITFFGKIDVLVNNAGFSQTGCLEELSDGELRKSFDTNFFGPVNLTKAILPHFRSTETESLICTVTSMCGIVSFPMAGAYASTKFALEGYFEGLSSEMKMVQAPVRVLCIAPGGFKTELIDNTKKPQNILDVYSPARVYMDSLLKNMHATGGIPKIGAKLMIDAMLQEGSAEGKEIPLRVPIGSDGVDIPLDKFKSQAEAYESWRSFAAEADSAMDGCNTNCN